MRDRNDFDHHGPFHEKDDVRKAHDQRLAICAVAFPVRQLARVVHDSFKGLVEFDKELKPEPLLPQVVPSGSLGDFPSAFEKRRSV